MKNWQKYCAVAMTTSLVMMNVLGGSIAYANIPSYDTIAPIIADAGGKSIDTVEVVLKDTGGFDMISLWDKNNYDIEGDTQVINVLTVNVDPANDLARVVLKTDQFTKQESLLVYIKNIKDASGNQMEESSRLILTDLSPTTLTSYSYKDVIFYGSGKNQVTVLYSQADTLDFATLKNIGNYTSNELMFYKLDIHKDAEKNTARVVLKSDRLLGNFQYHLFINNIKLKNGTQCETILKSDYITSYDEERFEGKTTNKPSASKSKDSDKEGQNSHIEDTSPPKVKSIRGKTIDTVEIILNDPSGFDMDSLWDDSNYKMKGSYDVKKVLSVDKSKDEQTTTVIVKTDDIKTNKSQKIRLSNIKDSQGNEIKTQYYSFGPAAYDDKEEDKDKAKDEDQAVVEEKPVKKDTTAPKVKMIRGKTPTSLELVFYDLSGFDIDSLKTVSNYDIQSDINVKEIASVEINGDGDKATIILTTDTFTSSKSQKILLSNIQDTMGNVIKEQKYSFGPVVDEE